MTIRTVSFLILSLLWLGAAEARMYRWVDENGVTVYSQIPPDSGEASEVKVKTAPPSTPKSADGEKNPAADSASGKQDQEKGPSKEEIAESNRIKEENCKAATHNLDLYENLGNRLVKTSDGLYKRYTEEERQAKIAESKRLMEEYCN